jgi:hypothetical protein
MKRDFARSLLLLALIYSAFSFVPLSTRFYVRNGARRYFARQTDALKSTETEQEVDVVVIGSGIGGLSCAALTSKYGLSTLCVEAHDTAGGCSHSFSRFSAASKTTPFRFDSGPSLVSGLSSKGTNPLRQVLDAIGTADSIDWCTYVRIYTM